MVPLVMHGRPVRLFVTDTRPRVLHAHPVQFQHKGKPADHLHTVVERILSLDQSQRFERIATQMRNSYLQLRSQRLRITRG